MDNLENRENQAQGNPEKQVQYYADGRFSNDTPDAAASRKARKPMPTWAKALIIIGAVILVIVLLATGCNKMVKGFTSGLKGNDSTQVETDFGHDYIGVIHVEGEISEDGTETYNHEYLLNSTDAMIDDNENKGMIIYVNTPGGSVFASDELYLKVKEYQKKTGRPVYSSMQSQATSGGYYISASCDKIIANRNCWTGSIGVTMGTIFDVTGLLDKAGIKTQTITSGKNKAMGSSTETLTAEQRAILQSLIDEAYDQFVGIVADGRNLKESEVRKLADGRIYTAKQAKNLGLVDEVGTFEEAVNDMKREYNLEDCQIEDFENTSSSDIWSILGESAENKLSSGSFSADMVKELTALNGKVEFSYISEIKK